MEQLTLNLEDNLTSSLEEPRVRTSPLPAKEVVRQREVERDQVLCGNGSDWRKSFDQEYSSGKMSLGRFQQTEDATSTPSFEPLMRSGIAWRGEYLTLNLPEWTAGQWPSRRDDAVCGLSDVLEEMSPTLQKYYLSPQALQGILRRAESRGKKLPKLLKTAIENMLQWWETQ